MAQQTFTYVSEQRLLYFTQKLKDKIPQASGLIDDTVKALTKTYSSSKIEDLLAIKLDSADLSTVIDDSATAATDKTFSVTKILQLISAITGLQFKKVQQLPASGDPGVIYLVAKQGTQSDVYDEFVWIEEDKAFEKIGTTQIDLSNYIQTTDMVEITTAQIDDIITTVFG